MVNIWRFTHKDAISNGTIMLILGSVLFAFEPPMTNAGHEQNTYAAAVVITAIALAYAVARLVRAMPPVSRKLKISYVWVIEILLACWVAAWIVEAYPLDLRLLVLLAGAHGILWGIWLLNLALQLRKMIFRSLLVCLLAALTSASGLVVALQPGLSRITAVTLVALYVVTIGTEIVLLELFLFRALNIVEYEPIKVSITRMPEEVIAQTAAV